MYEMGGQINKLCEENINNSFVQLQSGVTGFPTVTPTRTCVET